MSLKNVNKSTCSYCGVGCGVEVKVNAQGSVSVKGDTTHPVNEGMLCSKGMNLHHVVNEKSDRILYPHMRWSKSHPMVRVDWETAMTRAAKVFKSIIQKYGPDSVAFYVSGQCLTEEYYIANKLVKGFLGTNNIDTNSRLCMSSAVAGYKKAFGEDAVPVAYEDIELADLFLIAGANPAWCHPILYRRLEKHRESNPKVKVIVVDPRKTDTAVGADLHLQIFPGTDVTLFNSIAKRLIETGAIDREFISNHTDGYFDLLNALSKVDFDEASEICQIPVEEIYKAAEMIADAKGFITMWTMGLNQSVNGVDKNLSLLNLSILTGHIGKPGSGPFSLTGQPNAMGGREVGGLANMLAVHKELTNENHRKEVAEFWKVDQINPNPGLTATEIFKSICDDNVKAVWIICTNPVVSLPNVTEVEKALSKARFVVVQDISYKSDTVPYADLLLPAAGWLEKEGVMTNSERRLSFLPKIIDPPGEARPDTEILCDFARHMGFHGFDFPSVADIFSEYTQMTVGTNIEISMLNHKRLADEGTFQWPVKNDCINGTSRLFTNHKFYTDNGRAKIVPPAVPLRNEGKNEDFPFVLTTGRIRDQWHTMTKTGKVSRLNAHIPSAVVDIHPDDAKLYQINQFDIIEVFSQFGKVRVKANLTETIKKGVLFLPMHWGKILNSDLHRANNLTTNKIDPISKEPDFKYTPVNVRRYNKIKEKIIIIGAGAASFRFIQNYRDLNKNDEIIVFSDEPNPFYNRVLLPEYVSEKLSWSDLQKIKESELYKLNIKLIYERKVLNIDKSNKVVTDDLGEEYDYDKLILATGSRPFIPQDAQLDKPGRYVMRKKSDADKLRSYLDCLPFPNYQKHVILVGGGLLGLELAASLKEIDIRITIVQRASRLMERQLDNIASNLLAQEVRDKDIQIYFDNEVETVLDHENAELSVQLRSGKTLFANAIVYTIGTIPNIELAQKAGLNYGKGITINEYLQTNDENIFAIGEIAEFENKTYGITSAAEEQAGILANYFAGDISSVYKGSVLMNILKLQDVNLCSIGNITMPEADPNYQEVVFMDLAKRYYKKCILKNDLLVGAILVGDKSEFAEYKALIENKTELGEKRNELLRGKTESKTIIGSLLCSCAQVGTGNIQQALDGGCTNFTELCKSTGAGLGCGSCKTQIRDILEAHLDIQKRAQLV